MKTAAYPSRQRVTTWFDRGCLIAAMLCVTVSVSIAQQSESAKQKPHRDVYAPLQKVPASARTRRNPLEGDAREAQAGGKLFEQHCSECHGPKAGGTRYGPSLLADPVARATPGTLFWILTNGVVWHGMPVWSKLPEPERWQIVTFLQSLRPAASAADPPGEGGSH
ncbi:MAG TPA: cytochrome c [Terriglobales bacterium]|nr:cytochrome c [Terriglobales bacterium]